MPQKRQVMRNSFGDYRAKMAKEESKFKLEVSISPSGKDEGQTSKFVKRKSEQPQSSSEKVDGSGGGFKFNFSSPSAAGSS